MKIFTSKQLQSLILLFVFLGVNTSVAYANQGEKPAIKTADAPKELLNEDFKGNFGAFWVEGLAGGEYGLDKVWNIDSDLNVPRADGYTIGDAGHPQSSYLVSPVIKLETNNVMTFEYMSKYFPPEIITEQMMMSIRLVGGEWTNLPIPVCQISEEKFISSGEIFIPADFENKEVQIAFNYITDGTNKCSGQWWIRNLLVVSYDGKAPVSKVDPQISFPEAEYKYVIGTDSFKAPELVNPNKVEVTYASSNDSVATVAASGAVTILKAGEVTITATSAENDKYLAGTASYKIIISMPEKVDPQISFPEAEYKYVIGTDSFKAPELVNPNKVEVAYTSSNDSVATVTATGAVTILKAGEVTITATSAENDKYLAGTASYKIIISMPEKVDPQISFPEAEYKYVIGKEPFKAPKLVNPNKVEVTYASSDESIATVAATGEVTILKAGEVTITATSAENDKYLAGTASYKIIVSNDTAIGIVTAEDVKNGKVYDLQGRRVDRLVKGIYIINGKKIIIK